MASVALRASLTGAVLLVFDPPPPREAGNHPRPALVTTRLHAPLFKVISATPRAGSVIRPPEKHRAAGPVRKGAPFCREVLRT